MNTFIYLFIINNSIYDIKKLDLIDFNDKSRKYGYTIIRTKSYKSLKNNITDVGMKLPFISEIIFDVSDNKFMKDRYDGIYTYPNLNILFTIINDIINKDTFEILSERYNKTNILEAIYLTDSYNLYKDNIIELEYHMIRIQYGKKVPIYVIETMISEYPEILLKNI